MWFAAVSGPTATELARVQRTMPFSAEAIVSIDVIGQFAEHRDLYTCGIPFSGAVPARATSEQRMLDCLPTPTPTP